MENKELAERDFGAEMEILLNLRTWKLINY